MGRRLWVYLSLYLKHIPVGGCDGAVRVWDVLRHYGTHHFRGSPGVVQ